MPFGSPVVPDDGWTNAGGSPGRRGTGSPRRRRPTTGRRRERGRRARRRGRRRSRARRGRTGRRGRGAPRTTASEPTVPASPSGTGTAPRCCSPKNASQNTARSSVSTPTRSPGAIHRRASWPATRRGAHREVGERPRRSPGSRGSRYTDFALELRRPLVEQLAEVRLRSASRARACRSRRSLRLGRARRSSSPTVVTSTRATPRGTRSRARPRRRRRSP